MTIARVAMVDSSKHVLMAGGLLLLYYLIKVLESDNDFTNPVLCRRRAPEPHRVLHCREKLIEEHAFGISTLARSGVALAQDHSIACLSNLVKDDADLKLLIARNGGLISLKSFWDSFSIKILRQLDF
ncbi:hypothetical protein Hanom_Chr01g00027961 [Helianthus anomalus]